MKTSIKIGVIAACMSAASVFAADLNHTDKSFVEKAAKSGMAEVDLSRVALERSQNQQVRDFAQMMVDDHSGANTQLTSLASTKGLTLPMDKTNSEKWEKRSAKDFDHEYMEKMVSDHKDAVDLFEKEAKNGQDSEIRDFANKTLPKLNEHLQKAKDILTSLK